MKSIFERPLDTSLQSGHSRKSRASGTDSLVFGIWGVHLQRGKSGSFFMWKLITFCYKIEWNTKFFSFDWHYLPVSLDHWPGYPWSQNCQRFVKIPSICISIKQKHTQSVHRRFNIAHFINQILGLYICICICVCICDVSEAEWNFPSFRSLTQCLLSYACPL